MLIISINLNFHYFQIGYCCSRPLSSSTDLTEIIKKPTVEYRKVAKKLEPLLEFINFERIKERYYWPLKIISAEIILNQKLRLEYRGIPIYKFNEKDKSLRVSQIFSSKVKKK